MVNLEALQQVNSGERFEGGRKTYKALQITANILYLFHLVTKPIMVAESGQMYRKISIGFSRT